MTISLLPPDSSLNLDSLLIQLKEVEGDWKELGECFGVSPSQLDEIASHCLTAADSMIEVIDLWLREYPGRPTWREVAEALKQLHHYRLAEDINNVYSTGTCVSIVGLILFGAHQELVYMYMYKHFC